MWWHRHRHRDEAFDIVTPSERERIDRLVAWQRRRYLALIIPCLLLVLFGFFVPAPTPVRIVALALAALLLPLAAIVGNARR